MRRGLVALAWFASQGCFAASAPFAAPGSADAPALEARARADSADLRAIAHLALLHLSEGRTDQARAVLAPAAATLPDDPAFPLLLAIVDELESRAAAARDGYQTYRDAHVGPLARRAEQRGAAVESAALREDVERSLEDALPPVPEDRRRVAVLPFARSSSDEPAIAEAAAVATLIEWDLSDEWEVVDGALLRALLDEMDVAPTGRADVALGVDVGRRVGAARVVLGNMRRPSLETAEWDVTVVSIAAATSARVDHFTVSGSVGDVLAMQQRAAVLARASLEDRPLPNRSGTAYTVSVDALTWLGRGLLAMDRGDPSVAREAFDQAVGLDAQFAGPRALSSRMASILEAPSPLELAEEVVRIGELQRAVTALRTSRVSRVPSVLAELGRSERAPISELLGLDELTGEALIGLTFVLPGG